ncbi:MAG TPA: hypothetical protein VJ998_03900 [Pseudomonadales bacterium]|nr:hypothetical protein [Pseudomonadales bacterium]
MKIALDSNCLTYLIKACTGATDINLSTAEEGLALIRVWLYLGERYYISKKALEECQEIRDKDLREIHLAFANATYFGLEPKAPDIISARAEQFSSIHSGKGDCQVLAEAEDMGANILFSYDGDFIKNLGHYSDRVGIKRPSEYWESVQLPRGTVPKLIPHDSNPLASVTFWRW